jgi:hypothetical protein
LWSGDLPKVLQKHSIVALASLTAKTGGNPPSHNRITTDNYAHQENKSHRSIFMGIFYKRIKKDGGG